MCSSLITNAWNQWNCGKVCGSKECPMMMSIWEDIKAQTENILDPKTSISRVTWETNGALAHRFFNSWWIWKKE